MHLSYKKIALIIGVAIILVGIGGIYAYWQENKQNPYIPPGSLVVGTSTPQTASSTTMQATTTPTQPGREGSGERISAVSKSYNGISLIFGDGKTTGFIPVNFRHDDVLSIKPVDINFDGNDDVEIDSAAGAYNQDTDFYAYDPSTQKFQEYRKFKAQEDITGYVTFNAGNRTLATYMKGRGLGDIYVKKTYSFEQNDWRLVKTESQDIIGEDINADPLYFVKTIKEYVNGTATNEFNTYYKRTSGSSYMQEVMPDQLPF